MDKIAGGSRTQTCAARAIATEPPCGVSPPPTAAISRWGLISQGILQYLALTHPRWVWASFGSWLRTVRPDIPPSELVTAAAMRNALPEFLADSDSCPIFK